jgi:hypothetical protein
MVDVKISATHFERCKPAGEAVLKKAKEHYAYREESSKKEIGQMAKDAAQHFVNLARGKISVQIDPDAWERIFGKGKRNA